MGEEEGGEIVADRPSLITTTLNAGRVQSWLSDRITNAALNSRRSLPDRQFSLRWATKDAGNGQTCMGWLLVDCIRFGYDTQSRETSLAAWHVLLYRQQKLFLQTAYVVAIVKAILSHYQHELYAREKMGVADKPHDTTRGV